MAGLSDPILTTPRRLGVRPLRFRRRLVLMLRGRRATAAVWLATLALTVGMMALAYAALGPSGAPQKPLKPFVVALLLIGNLLPMMVLFVLLARRLARSRAERSGMKSRGTLHVRLVVFFSAIAALPTVLVAIFSSLLFQYGVEFWFSDRARIVLQNADRVAQTYVDEHKSNLGAEADAMKGDLLNWMNNASPDDPRSQQYFASQVYYRKLDQAALIQVEPDGREYLIYGGNLDARPMEQRLPPALLPALADNQPHFRARPDQFEAAIAFDRSSHTYLWISRHADPLVLAQTGRANTALGEYRTLLARSRTLQLQFNLALYLVSLLIVAIAIWVALRVADRIVRPIGDLVGAARRVAAGDLAARVEPSDRAQNEVGTLAAAFNRMTRRLQEQTGALETRRALTEAVLSGVTAGVISVDALGVVTIINPSAITLLGSTSDEAIGAPLIELAPELAELLDSGERQSVIQLAVEGEVRTLAATVGRANTGHVLTFDDITQQLADQRRAAWSDVARRIAHEIKNPLTPIQLAAERLQRRYGRQIENDDGTFTRLVSTIVRQVGDIRRMIDEFSAFARMPKPNFEEESVVDLARHALFLHEVAHPAIGFRLDAPQGGVRMVCDRRQLGQALTNLVKNAVEAIEGRGEDGLKGEVVFTIAPHGEQLILTVADNGIGLPAERERLTEPYMTTRAKGTGLGLAIVQKIVEDHLGTMSFADRPGGGAVVRLTFDPGALAPLINPTENESHAAPVAAGRM